MLKQEAIAQLSAFPDQSFEKADFVSFDFVKPVTRFEQVVGASVLVCIVGILLLPMAVRLGEQTAKGVMFLASKIDDKLAARKAKKDAAAQAKPETQS